MPAWEFDRRLRGLIRDKASAGRAGWEVGRVDCHRSPPREPMGSIFAARARLRGRLIERDRGRGGPPKLLIRDRTGSGGPQPPPRTSIRENNPVAVDERKGCIHLREAHPRTQAAGMPTAPLGGGRPVVLRTSGAGGRGERG